MPVTNSVFNDRPVLRLCEYGTCTPSVALEPWQKDAVEDAALRWKEMHRLNRVPLRWEGKDGNTLRAAQYVGVVEAGGLAIEIYPKLDKAALSERIPKDGLHKTLLSNLLWMMEVAENVHPPETDSGSLDESPDSFMELFALLLGRRLYAELAHGRIRRYVSFEDDLHTVRGRIDFRSQFGRLANRYDKIACRWDELTPDVAVNQVLRCACQALKSRIKGVVAARLLENCLSLLDEVSEVPPDVALRMADKLPRFDRTMERFRIPFALAVRLLRGLGHEMRSANAETFVFLTDMNALWEGYVGALLSSLPAMAVETQTVVGYLLPELPMGGIQQQADFVLQHASGNRWIGDAKYKHLTAGQNRPLKFADIAMESDEQFAGKIISPDDVRQLTVYAELDARKRNDNRRADLLLLYPYVGDAPLESASATAWNGSKLTLVPVGVRRLESAIENLAPFS